MPRAIALSSGGLDSILAIKLILNQGIEVEAINFSSVFWDYNLKSLEKLSIKFGAFEVSQEFLRIVKSPKYGYGRNLNPCIDCRIFMLKKAGQYMKEIGVDFLITGEVLGERPMSQRRDALKIIERDSGLKGLILRPLSARLLEPTIPEIQGIVDREKLKDFCGRSRKPQMKLAEELEISTYPTPSGGCLLTDIEFTKRMKDLIRYEPDFTLEDIQLLKLGRHFRLSPRARLVVGRDKEENEQLLKLAREGDIYFRARYVKGPIGLGRPYFDRDTILLASQIIARYCDGYSKSHVEIIAAFPTDTREEIISVSGLNEERIRGLRI